MNVHGNAKLGPAGRRSLVGVVEGGVSMREAAAMFGVSPATVHRWWVRWRQATERPPGPAAPPADRAGPAPPEPRPVSPPAPARDAGVGRAKPGGAPVDAGEGGD